MTKLGRRGKLLTYHGRKGFPVVHVTRTGKKFIMVRAKSGGVKRLYEGTKYSVNGKINILRL